MSSDFFIFLKKIKILAEYCKKDDLNSFFVNGIGKLMFELTRLSPGGVAV
jgi:hypothetical protein